MHNLVEKNNKNIIYYLILIPIFIIFVTPIYMVLINSFKTFEEIFMNPFGMSTQPNVENYIEAWNVLDLISAFKNSVIITVFSMGGEIILSSMAAYWITRRKTRFHKILYSVLVAAMVVPFPALMISELQVWSFIGLNNTLAGLIMCYYGFGTPFAVFLYHGFIKSIPVDVEEAAYVDGASTFGVFFRIVLPMLGPTTATLCVLHSLWFWNDYLLPLIMLQRRELRTIPLAISFLFDQFNSKWDLAMAAIMLAIVPALIIFLIFQKYIVKGVAAGAVKG